MAQDNIIRDYTNRDYSSILASMLDYAALKLPEWTDRSVNDAGRMILEGSALASDIILYYLDRLAAESFPGTAQERRSIIDLLGLIGYTLSTPAPAAAVLRLTVKNDSASPVIVSPGARFATKAAPGNPAVEFAFLPSDGKQIIQTRTGTGGEISFDIVAINANQVGRESLGRSTGEPNQSFILRQTPVLLPRDTAAQGYLQVEIDPGTGFELWERKDTLLFSLSSNRHYTTRVRDTDEVEIITGDGTYGMIPPPNSEVRATYLSGGGAAGNVGPNTITEVKSGVSVPAKCANALASAGGADRESIEHAKRLAPLVWRSQQRAVTATDYAALAQSVEGVARAFAVAPSWSYVDLYVIAAGGLPPSPDLQNRLLRFFEARRPVTTLISVRAAVLMTVNFTIQIGVDPVFYQSDVASRVRAAIEALFAIERLDFGQTIYISKIFEAAEQIAGVAFVQVLSFSGIRRTTPPQIVSSLNGMLQLNSGQTPFAPPEFPQLGTLVINTTGGLS